MRWGVPVSKYVTWGDYSSMNPHGSPLRQRSMAHDSSLINSLSTPSYSRRLDCTGRGISTTSGTRCLMKDQWVCTIFHSPSLQKYTSVVFQGVCELTAPSGVRLEER